MAIVKIKLAKKVNNVVNDYYPKTSADNVVYDSNNSVEDKISSIESVLTAHAVTNKGSAFVSGLYKITINSEGHVTAATPVTKSDITGLGIPDAATTQTVLTFDNVPAEHSENPVKSSGIYSALAGKISVSAKGANGGVAELDSNGKVPSSQLPSYVDDVLSYNSISSFPTTGEDGKIYIAKDTNLSYRWTGSEYGVISPSLALGSTSSTAYRGDWGAEDRANIGTLTDLQTTEKNNLVAAINEIKSTLTYSNATPSTNGVGGSAGLMSAADKTKLDGISIGQMVYIDENTTNITLSSPRTLSESLSNYKIIEVRVLQFEEMIGNTLYQTWGWVRLIKSSTDTFSAVPVMHFISNGGSLVMKGYEIGISSSNPNQLVLLRDTAGTGLWTNAIVGYK